MNKKQVKKMNVKGNEFFLEMRTDARTIEGRKKGKKKLQKEREKEGMMEGRTICRKDRSKERVQAGTKDQQNELRKFQAALFEADAACNAVAAN